MTAALMKTHNLVVEELYRVGTLVIYLVLGYNLPSRA